MADEANTTDEAPAAAPKIVNFDAGEKFDGEVVTLKRPFQLGGAVYTTVTLRTPTGDDYDRYTKADAKLDTFGLLTAFSGLPIAALQAMASVDVKALDVALGKLFWG